MASFNATREATRPTDYATPRARHIAAREKAKAAGGIAAEVSDSVGDARRNALFDKLGQVDQLLALKNYAEAETQLRAMLQEFQGEPRIFFALAQGASLSAQDAFDEKLQSQRLNTALSLYQQAVLAAAPDTDGDKALISRAHAARGRIFTFLERRDEALKEFDAALKVGDVRGGAYKEAQASRQQLMSPR